MDDGEITVFKPHFMLVRYIKLYRHPFREKCISNAACAFDPSVFVKRLFIYVLCKLRYFVCMVFSVSCLFSGLFFKDKQYFLCNLSPQQAQLCLRAFINLQPMEEMHMMNIQLFSSDESWQVVCIIHEIVTA